MKSMVRSELESEGYSLTEEPLCPPSGRMSWSGYRPDLLGFRRSLSVEEVVIVECETHPSMNRFRSKNHSSLWFQASVFHDGRIRRVLAIPRGRLGAVDLRLRDEWEIWILGAVRPLEKLGTLESPGAPREIAPGASATVGSTPRETEIRPPPIRAGKIRR